MRCPLQSRFDRFQRLRELVRIVIVAIGRDGGGIVRPRDTGCDLRHELIILAAAPYTAMVFVRSYLSDGNPAYTLVQVSINDLIMLVAFAPIVKFLVSGTAGLEVPFRVLLYAVLIRGNGVEWFDRFMTRFHAVPVLALLATLVLIIAFQAENITARWFHVLLIGVPILLQVYFNSSLTYGLMKLFRAVPDRRPRRADRSFELLRVSRSHRDRALWPRLRPHAGDRRRYAARGAGDAVRLPDVHRDAALARAGFGPDGGGMKKRHSPLRVTIAELV